ncbi:hypothetical protein CPC08DRAFT_721091 [Agrocybe pediades]|nr:hypothetical protein CPC08DRAFT_721091 [Agrocybe pediades]
MAIGRCLSSLSLRAVRMSAVNGRHPVMPSTLRRARPQLSQGGCRRRRGEVAPGGILHPHWAIYQLIQLSIKLKEERFVVRVVKWMYMGTLHSRWRWYNSMVQSNLTTQTTNICTTLKPSTCVIVCHAQPDLPEIKGENHPRTPKTTEANY